MGRLTEISKNLEFRWDWDEFKKDFLKICKYKWDCLKIKTSTWFGKKRISDRLNILKNS